MKITTYNQFLGQGYGQAQDAIRKERAVEKAISRLGGDIKLVYESYWSGDRYENSYGAGSAWKHTTLREVLTELADNCNEEFSGLMLLADVSEMWSDYCECDDGGAGWLMTETDMKKEQQESRRKKLEATASNFAAQCGHKVGTREYVLAARKAIQAVRYKRQRWNDGETRMEQAAACHFSGGGHATYFDDLNFENGRFDNKLDCLSGVLEWLEEVCPLLMRQMEQEKMVAAGYDDDDDDDEYFG